jgi:hypothetical protein
VAHMRDGITRMVNGLDRPAYPGHPPGPPR